MYRILRFIYATGVACQKRTLTPPETLSRPIWDLHMFFFLRPIFFPNLSLFFRTVGIFPDYAIRIFPGTFSILLEKMSTIAVKISFIWV